VTATTLDHSSPDHSSLDHASMHGTGIASWLAHAGVMARRSIRGVARQPQLWAPSLIFPLFFSAVSAAAFSRTTSLPGFPEVDSFLTFLVPATILQGVMFGATSAGTEQAIDMENGFNDRLLAAPVARVPLLLGRLGGIMVLSVLQAVLFTVVLVVAGASFAGGVAGLLAIMAVAALMGAAVGAFAMAIALKTGSVEAVNGFFPIFFALVFLSSAFFPPELSGGWFEAVASVNPVTWMIDGTRDLVVHGWDVEAAVSAIGVAAGLLALFLALALQALRSSLRS